MLRHFAKREQPADNMTVWLIQHCDGLTYDIHIILTQHV
jgi:hypothetical protein